MTNDELQKRTKRFAHKCVDLALSLPNKIRITSSRSTNQMLTSVAANYRAACLAQSKPLFIAKLSIIIGEIDESYFWIEFIIERELVKKEQVVFILNESKELTKIFISSRMTATKGK